MSKRARLALWCCSAFLEHDSNDGPDYYDLLSISHSATPAAIKSAYKKKSLAMHPDKLAQQGREMTEDDRTQFIKVKDAYETLMNPKTRAVYDSLGEKGYNWYNDPMSIDRKELLHNFCTSSLFDRSKILFLFCCIFLIVTLPPVLFCIRADGNITSVPFSAILTPLWLFDVFLFYVHIRSIMLPTVEPPEDNPNWVDPFPRSVRILDFLSFLTFATFTILAVGKLDGWDDLSVSIIFIPYFLYESIKFVTAVPKAFLGVISIEEIEELYKKSVFDMTPEERADVDAIFTVIAPAASNEYREGIKKKSEARSSILWCLTRTMVAIFLVLNLEDTIEWSYWAVFAPFWAIACCVCCTNCMGVVQNSGELTKLESPDDPEIGTNYGSMGVEGEKLDGMTAEEKEELKQILGNKLQDSTSGCCGALWLAGFVALIVGRIAGADYSSVWILFPFLFFMGLIFCCICYGVVGANEEAFRKAEEEEFGENGGGFGAFGGAAGAAPSASVPEPTLEELSGKDISEMKVKEMKNELRLRGVETRGMVEKEDIVEGLRKAREGKVGEGVGGSGGAGAGPVFNMPYVPPTPAAAAAAEPVKEEEVKVVVDMRGP
eukprot:CAMPEP_0118659262 /NCGR_PEP_ID=MMETSP0785-20121206/15015_1 /TAXON_ID=91992 /ORGANISM="Bolidomonas pacifica, Strain CCMP 1866" /LENGTH=603 /DNA_ID=CAMNT_0006552349 /DNA_START=126 /DNA_END=1937 /DNA_ORIENTATION=-